MGKIAIIHNGKDILRVISVSRDTDLELNCNKAKGEKSIEIKNNHPLLSSQKNWKVSRGKLKHKSKKEIEGMMKERLSQDKPLYTRNDTDIHSDIMVEFLNEIRSVIGIDGNVTTDQIKEQIKTRKEQFKNPDKK